MQGSGIGGVVEQAFVEAFIDRRQQTRIDPFVEGVLAGENKFFDSRW